MLIYRKNKGHENKILDEPRSRSIKTNGQPFQFIKDDPITTVHLDERRRGLHFAYYRTSRNTTAPPSLSGLNNRIQYHVTADTRPLIQLLSRRQWMVLLAVVALTLGSLLLVWLLLESAQDNAALINVAGRQRMLSQRMALHTVIQRQEPDQEKQRQHHDWASAAAAEFEQGHGRLTDAARKSGPGSAIHSLYFGPRGNIDAESRRYLAQVREVLGAAARGKQIDTESAATIVAAAAGMVKPLEEITELHQQADEQKEDHVIQLLVIYTLLMFSLMAFDTLKVFRPVIRRLTNDAAGRDRAEHDFKQTEEHFSAFLECSSDWFWETDKQHRFTWIKNGSKVSALLTNDQVRGRTRQEMLDDVEKAAVEKWRAHQADLDAHRPFRNLEYQLRAIDQTKHWISVNGQPFFDNDGSFLGYRGTTSYIQTRKDLEEAVLRLQLAIEHSPVAIMITDAQRTIIHVNSHFTAITGYSSEDAIGRTPDMLSPAEMADDVRASISKDLAAGKIWRGEVCGRNKHGSLYWVSQSISPVSDHQGIVTHHVSVSEDITAKKQIIRREQGYNRILQAIANGTPLLESLDLMTVMVEAELAESTCGFLRLDPARGTLHDASSSGPTSALAKALDGLAIGEEIGACGTAACTGKDVFVGDIGTRPQCKSCKGIAAAEGMHACWSKPILSSAGKVLGVLIIHYRSPRSPVADALQVIDLISGLASICLERDETDQSMRRQEEQARTLVAEHQTIFNNAMVGIVYLKHRKVVSCNRRLEQIFGYDPGELIGESSARFYPSQQVFESIGRDAYRVIADNRNFSTELMLKHKDGSLFRGALNGRAIDPAKPQEGSIWVYADISERHRAEQEAHKLLQAVEQSPVSIMITNPEGLIEYVNPRFTRVTGFDAHEAMGRNPRMLQSGETPAETYQDLWQALLAGRQWHGILRNRRKNGELFWEEASISPIIDDMNQVTHYLAIKEDITQRKHIEDELEQHRVNLEYLVERRTADLSAALDAAKVADEAKDAFLANVSHELRTPLNAVIGLSDLARRISTHPKQQDYLDKVAGAGKTLAKIINDLLDLSKISAGRMELEATSFRLSTLIQRTRSVMAVRAIEKGLDLVDQIDAGVPDVLLGDSLRIEQILLNLLSNAVKFTPSGHIGLRISVIAREAPRVCLNIEVKDSGIGLSEENIARLFQPFAQADASINRKFGGTGLGLALCKRLAEMMDGGISVRSQEGVGTTFQVRLWLGLGMAADLPQEEASRAETLPVRYRNAQVLVVDDQALNREIVESLLALVGITTRSAANGQEAIDLLSEAGPNTFDLVLMDIQMPVVDGLTATRMIRKLDHFARLPVIAMTAHTMEHEKIVSRNAGMNDHIGKPFDTARFFQVLARWIPAIKHQMTAGEPASDAPTASAVGLTALSSIDTQAGLARFVGNETRYRHWLAEFVTEAPDYAAGIRRLLATAQREAARQSAHAIKGRVGMLGMTALHSIVTALEAALKQGTATDDLLDRMQAAIDPLCAEIQAALGVSPPNPDPASERAQRPAGPMPESIRQLVVMFRHADGNSAEAVERCIEELSSTGWLPILRQAQPLTRNFDFEAAVNLLDPDNPDATGEDGA